MAGNSKKAIIAALFANLGIAIAKFAGFLITASSSLLAESIHSVADTGNQALLLLGGRQARKQPTEAHNFGYGRERYFWSFVVALVLFSLGSLFAIFEGIEKLRHPHELESPGVAIGILVVAIALESWSFHTAIVEARPLKGDLSWWRFIQRAKQPELPVVLLEDFGALTGLALALGAVSLTIVTDNSMWDALGTITIGSLLGVIAVVLAHEMKSLLIGESADPEVRQTIEDTIARSEHTVALIHLRTQHIGPDEVLVGAKIDFGTAGTPADLATHIDAVEAEIRAAVPVATVIYLEPDIQRLTEDEQAAT
jgi:cation diffusion facilitator family transporter